MLKLTLHNLTPDASALQAGTHELGKCDSATLQALLENFRRLSATEVAASDETEPVIVIATPTGKFLVRTGSQKLFLYNARDSNEPYAELTAEAIVAQLAAPSAPLLSEDAGLVTEAKSANRTAAFAILIVGLILNGYTLYSVFYTERVNQPPAVTLLTDLAEIQNYARRFSGMFQTGDSPGDRAIIIAPDGTLRFIEFLTRNRRAETIDTYQVGRHEGKVCFTTASNGVIAISSSDALLYYRDTYRRIKL